MTSPQPDDIASLAMYPFASLQDAWDRLYQVVASRVADAPARLSWDLEPHDAWTNRRLAVAMSCGWPVVTSLRGRVRVVGTFVFATDDGSSPSYRSLIVSQSAASVGELVEGRAAVNSADSLSGSVSLLHSIGERADAVWPGGVEWTGSHIASVEAVRSGRAVVASIDAMTWMYLRRDDPGALRGLVVIDRGPLVPTLPLVVRADCNDDHLAEWRSAFAHAVRDPLLRTSLSTLRIDGFVSMDLADYAAALASF